MMKRAKQCLSIVLNFGKKWKQIDLTKYFDCLTLEIYNELVEKKKQT